MGELDAIWTELATEQQNPAFHQLDSYSAIEIVRHMNQLDQTVPLAIEQVLPAVAEAIERVVTQLSGGGRLFYIGAGTSGRLGVLDAAECPPTFNTPPELVQAVIAGGNSALFYAVENAEDNVNGGAVDLKDRQLSADDVVVGIAASGHTPYVVGALRYARNLGAATVAVTCNQGSKVGEIAEIAIEIPTGPEMLMGSTRLKAGTAQKLVLNMISTGAMIRLGKVYENLMVDLKATNKKLIERSKRIIMLATDVDYDEAAEQLAAANGHVKAAIVMIKKNVSLDMALRLLDTCDGFLRAALESDLHDGETK